jgi:hypothetical protein
VETKTFHANNKKSLEFRKYSLDVNKDIFSVSFVKVLTSIKPEPTRPLPVVELEHQNKVTNSVEEGLS